jgi:peptide-methionine (R)-S-oxide reductase
MDRRTFIQLAAGGAGVLMMGRVIAASRSMSAAEVITRINRSDAEWLKLLNAQQYDVLRKEGTERPFSSPLNSEKRKGIFICAGCDLPLFPSEFKYDSGTGWPSFYDALPGRLETKQDFQLVLPRTEYHCARCGGHHGHVFNDGPRPTGLRYCNNGVALKFIPEKS